MMKTLFTEELLAKYSYFPKNYNYEEIWNSVHLAELKYIKPLVGDELYNELLDQVEQNTVTGENASLLIKLYPYLGACVVEIAAPLIAYRLNAAGITKGHSENSESLSMSELNYLINHVRSSLNILKADLVDFLERNKEHFPLLVITTGESVDNRIYGFDSTPYDIK